MQQLYATLEGWMHDFTRFSILILEAIGVVLILFAGIRGVVEYARHRPGAQLRMASAMAFALEFKLGGEILRTVLVRELSEIFIVGCIIALRGILNYLIHRDIHEQQKMQQGACEELPQRPGFWRAAFGPRPKAPDGPDTKE